MNSISISSKDLINKNRIKIPQKASEFSSYSFWYYTSFNTANLILENSKIYISNITKMNDTDEISMHGNAGAYVHCLCLCNSNTEKIPMWYLYSGIAGKGLSIGFTPSTLVKLIQSIDTLTASDRTVLQNGVDFSMEYGWIFYRKPTQSSQVCYKRKWYTLIDPDNFTKDNYFIKAYPWEYEKEFRIVIHNKTGKQYDYLILDISSVYKKLKIKLAPEITQEEFNNLLPDNKGFANYALSKINYSNLGIKMDLCKRNFNNFLDYISMNVDRPASETGIEVDKICSSLATKCQYHSEDSWEK